MRSCGTHISYVQNKNRHVTKGKNVIKENVIMLQRNKLAYITHVLQYIEFGHHAPYPMAPIFKSMTSCELINKNKNKKSELIFLFVSFFFNFENFQHFWNLKKKNNLF